MATGGSRKVVITAFIGNFLIAITKLSAALYTGAAAMFAEAIHSFVDSGNQLLMLVGMARSKRPATAKHPFGYGMESYFWSFVVAILLFSIGAVISLYEGFERVLHPQEVSSPIVNYVVLGLALLFEGYALRAAVLETRRRLRPGESVWAFARRSKDAPLFTVLFEDVAAMSGIVIALICLILAQMLDMPVLDGVGSMLIGLLLAFAALFLAIETKSLLIGEAADPELVAFVRGLADDDPRVLRVNEVLSMHLGPEDVLVAMSIDFDDARTAGEVEAAISEFERRIKARWPEVRRVFIEAQGADAHRAADADRAAEEPGSA